MEPPRVPCRPCFPCRLFTLRFCPQDAVEIGRLLGVLRDAALEAHIRSAAAQQLSHEIDMALLARAVEWWLWYRDGIDRRTVQNELQRHVHVTAGAR